MVQGESHAGEWVVMFPEQEYIFGDFTERLWAYLTIQQLLNKQYVQYFPNQKHFHLNFLTFTYDSAAQN